MKLRIAQTKDLNDIMRIIGDAQLYLASLGIDQWQDGYPTIEQIHLDLANNDSFVVVNDTGEVIATTVFTTKIEPTYKQIEGEWLSSVDAQYGVIHRLAVAAEYRKSGVAKFVFETCAEELKERDVESMRIDTHRENLGMQYLLKRQGYSYCGVIYLENGDERLAYELLLS